MKNIILLLMLVLPALTIAQSSKKEAAKPATTAETQKETLKLMVGDKFSALGVEGKLFDLYNASGGEACRKSDHGKVLSAAVAYIEFKYDGGRKVSTELCFQRVSKNKEDKVGEEHHSKESFKAKDGVISIEITSIKEKEGIVTIEITKAPLPEKK